MCEQHRFTNNVTEWDYRRSESRRQASGGEDDRLALLEHSVGIPWRDGTD